MRTTTELTARFNLTAGFYDGIDLLIAREEDAGTEEDFFYSATVALEEGIVAEDALDMITVSFDSVVEDLSFELFNQDAADDRIYDCNDHCCARCGLEENDEWELLTHLGGQWLCQKCMPKSFETRMMLQELDRKRAVRAQNVRAEKAVRFRAALAQAKIMRPDLNWDQYQYDPRQWA